MLIAHLACLLYVMNIEDFADIGANGNGLVQGMPPRGRAASLAPGQGDAGTAYGNAPAAGSITHNLPPTPPAPNTINGNEGFELGGSSNARTSNNSNASTQFTPSGNARITFYHKGEDQYGDTTAKPGPDGRNIAQEGTTIAVDPSLIPYGSGVHIPGLKDVLGHDAYYAHDTGGAVKSQQASRGKLPIIDVYLGGNGADAEKRIPQLEAGIAKQYPKWETEGIPYSVLGKLNGPLSKGNKAFSSPQSQVPSAGAQSLFTR